MSVIDYEAPSYVTQVRADIAVISFAPQSAGSGRTCYAIPWSMDDSLAPVRTLLTPESTPESVVLALGEQGIVAEVITTDWLERQGQADVFEICRGILHLATLTDLANATGLSYSRMRNLKSSDHRQINATELAILMAHLRGDQVDGVAYKEVAEVNYALVTREGRRVSEFFPAADVLKKLKAAPENVELRSFAKAAS